MLRLLCSPDYFREYTDNCILNVVDTFGATSIDSPIHTLNQGDHFTCNCNLYGSQSLEWFLQKVNGEKISLVTTCYTPYTRCVIWYNPTNFELQTSRMWGLNLYQSNLTVKHVDKDMLRVFCSSDFFQREQDRCLMNVVDYVRSDNVTTKSSTNAPDVYLNTYPEQPFLTTPFQFLFPTTPEPAAENYTSSVALKITVIVLPFIALFVLTTLAVCCCCRKKKVKRLQRHNEAMRVISITPQLTPEMAPGPDQNDRSSTRVNELVQPSNSTLTTESQQHTSIQSSAPNDSPPTYSSLLELRVEPPPCTTLTSESYNCQSAPSHQAQNVPPPYTTRYIATYNSVSLSAQQQAPNMPPPPYSGCDVGWFEPQCQDKCSSRNDSMDSFVKEAHSTESSRPDVCAVGSCPHDVRCTAHFGEMDFTKIVNTYPANESVEILFSDKRINDGTENKTTKPDLDYIFQVDHLDKLISICLKFTVHETKGDSTERVKLSVTVTDIKDTKLDQDLTPDTDEMRVYTLLRITHDKESKNPSVRIEQAVKLPGNIAKLRINQHYAEVLTFKLNYNSGDSMFLNLAININIHVKTMFSFEIPLAVIVTSIFTLTICCIILKRRRNKRLASQQLQIAALQPPPATAF
ncbi:uncharacterized protein LOC131934830 [Physella acuta]|uniref:uncharacterized protein LOC131934830 n=1 Tax=Physella acuta TaxID=109671 RepID=UPI0027DCA6DD|nr:uncharacterized protein LOC131934830 [Physella acuta]